MKKIETNSKHNSVSLNSKSMKLIQKIIRLKKNQIMVICYERIKYVI